ncbi:MAG: YggT family protein [Natronincolaceae bacterium]|nr:YggT family protein [Bacillota bacterium]NLK90141.1 YggT family protein [Clostridiales bacterium]
MFASQAVADTLWHLVRLINVLILVRIALQFFNINPSNPIVRFIYDVTEFILAPIRNVISNLFGYSGFLDFSPLVAIILIQVIYNIVVRIL